jgi:hypothetical protein
MTTPSMAELSKYADLQMAAEAFLVQDEATGQLKSNLQQALTEGNFQASRFTATQATAFLAHWKVVDQKTNTPPVVAHNQWQIGKDYRVFIKDRPFYCGGIGAAALAPAANDSTGRCVA